MKEQMNAQIVGKAFELIGKGDLPSALELFSDEVTWKSPMTQSKHEHITWSKPRHGREEVAAFFKELTDKIQLGKVQVKDIISQDDKVVVDGRNGGTVKATSKTYDHEWVMIFTLKNGKITSCRHFYDTADVIQAF